MLSDFKLIKHDFPKCEGITIVPVADVHFGAGNCMEKEFINFLKYVEETPGIYLTLGGDLINNGLRGSVGNPFDEKYRPSAQKKMMADLLYPVRDRILCGTGGNHEARSMKDSDTDITYDIFSKLDIEHLYRPSMAVCQLRFGYETTCHKDRINYVLAVTHGSGGGALTGSAVNKNERFATNIDGIDALIVGHTHKPVVTTPTKMKVDINNGVIKMVPFKVITASSWLGYGGYALSKMLAPANNTEQKLFLNGKKKEMTVYMT